jgi:hypothetical protein
MIPSSVARASRPSSLFQVMKQCIGTNCWGVGADINLNGETAFLQHVISRLWNVYNTFISCRPIRQAGARAPKCKRLEGAWSRCTDESCTDESTNGPRTGVWKPMTLKLRLDDRGMGLDDSAVQQLVPSSHSNTGSRLRPCPLEGHGTTCSGLGRG